MKDLVKLEDLQEKDMATMQPMQPQKLSSTVLPQTMPSTEDTGSCSSANPYVPYDIAPIVLVFNIFFSGVGTLVAAYYDPSGCNCKTITCGIFQLFTSFVMVGWVWSVVQGCMIYNKSMEYYWSCHGGQPTSATQDSKVKEE